jgi:very-short-patch-repair endonuclease
VKSTREEQFVRLWAVCQKQFAKRHPFVREHRFHPERRWRFDFAWPDALVAVEIEGGTFTRRGGRRSRHTTGKGHQEDCRKYNAAAIAGWCVLKYTSADLNERPVQVCAEIAEALQSAERWQELSRQAAQHDDLHRLQDKWD